MTSHPITEAKNTDSRLELIRKLINKADEMTNWLTSDIHGHAAEHELQAAETERDQINARVAELIAKYGIDTAMLADLDTSGSADPIVDRVIWAVRPYGNAMQDLLVSVATPLGAQVRRVKEWDPKAPGGRKPGAWKYGLRLFVHASDLARIEILFASVRNQALAGATHITGSAEFGQDQRAYRINYFSGFGVAIHARLDRAEQAAREAAEAEQQERADQAMLTGAKVGRSVELVVSSRSDAVKNAMRVALYGKTSAEMEAATAANRERWAEQDRKAQERWEAHVESHKTCAKCHAAKSGYCQDHRDLRPSQGRAYTPSVGADYFDSGYRDGYEADLGSKPGSELGGSRKSIR